MAEKVQKISDRAREINAILARLPPRKVSVHQDILTRVKPPIELEKEKKPLLSSR